MQVFGAKTGYRVAIAIAGILTAHVALAQMSDASPTVPPAGSPAVAEIPQVFPVVATLTNPPPARSPREIECMAKVVVHEAGNQPLRGQMAVAQVVRARMEDGRFAPTACGVVKQRGQFFDVDAYDPPRTSARWIAAVRIAADVLAGESEDVAGGALFFHAAGATMPGRTRVVQIADHIFYR